MRKGVFAFLAGAWIFLGACGNNDHSTSGNGTAPEQALTPASMGEMVFKQNCATCHNMKFDGTGPSLAGVLGRWNNDTSRIKAYIRNPSKMIDAGDPEATKAYEKFKPTIMTPFPEMSQEDLDHLLAYLKENGG